MLVFALFDAKQDKATVVFDEASTTQGGLEKELLSGQVFSFNKVNFLVVSLNSVVVFVRALDAKSKFYILNLTGQ